LAAIASIGLLGGAFALSALSALAACSSTDDVSADDPDVVEGGLRESGALDVNETGPPCDVNGDLFGKVRDAAIADGASTTGLCLGCAKRACGDAVGKCTRDCPCQSIVGNSLECYVTTQQLGCAGALANIFVTPATRQHALELLGCVQQACAVECAVDAGNAPDAGDAGGDGG
jgi:hypothetical protein